MLEELRELSPGAILLFSRNITSVEATRALADALRAALGDVLIAIDQEGGRVARLRLGATPVPSMMALGACGDEGLAERVGLSIAGDLRRAGADVDFAPVLDLALEPQSAIVGTRSFGDDPVRVAALGAAVTRGLQRGGVAATLKHFPGHGATEFDSHAELPVVGAGGATLRERELVPFAAGIAAGARCVMSAHVVFPALDAERPATLSPTILTGLLRDELGFAGVCVTDCLEMDAVAAHGGSVAAAVAALRAGADLLTVSHTLGVARQMRTALAHALEAGTIEDERMRQAVARVDDLRRCLARAQPQTDPDPHWVAHQVARRAITLVRGRARLDLNEPATVVSFEGESADGVGSGTERASLNRALRTRGMRSEILRVPLEPEPEMVEHLRAVLAAQRGRNVVIVMRRAHRHRSQRSAIDALLASTPQAWLVSALEPFDVGCFPRARNVLCSYGDGALECEALADVLSGRAGAGGKLPVRLPASAP